MSVRFERGGLGELDMTEQMAVGGEKFAQWGKCGRRKTGVKLVDGS